MVYNPYIYIPGWLVGILIMVYNPFCWCSFFNQNIFPRVFFRSLFRPQGRTASTISQMSSASELTEKKLLGLSNLFLRGDRLFVSKYLGKYHLLLGKYLLEKKHITSLIFSVYIYSPSCIFTLFFKYGWYSYLFVPSTSDDLVMICTQEFGQVPTLISQHRRGWGPQ